MSRWRVSADGKPRVTLQVKHYVDAVELASILAYCFPTYEDLKGLSRAQLVRAVQGVFESYGAEGWPDRPSRVRPFHRDAVRQAFGAPEEAGRG